MDHSSEKPRYVTAVGLDDVQLGRGRPVVTSEGNQRFRALIIQHKPEYSSSNRHAHKDVVARTILSIISDRGGKFLRKIESKLERKKLAIVDGVDAWEVADDETSINKVKQALRENETSVASTVSLPLSNPRTTKKASLHFDLVPPAKVGKRGADSDSGRSNAASMKSSSPKKKHKREVQPPISLADSIRANARKLGTDYSFIGSSDSLVQSNVSAAVAFSETGASALDYSGSKKQEHINTARRDQSANLNRLEYHLASASSITGNYATMFLTGNDSQHSGDQYESAQRSDKRGFVRQTSASVLSVSDDKNKSIRVDLDPIDSRREYFDHVLDGTDITTSHKGSSSDEDKKPAAM